MEPNAWIIFLPLVLPYLLVGIGGIAGFYTNTKVLRAGLAPCFVLAILLIFAIASAVIPNIRQQFYNLGLSFTFMEIVQGASYFTFGFTITAAWLNLSKFWRVCLLVVLVPVAFAGPIEEVLTLIIWHFGGFAP